jgi:hypothetical protein
LVQILVRLTLGAIVYRERPQRLWAKHIDIGLHGQIGDQLDEAKIASEVIARRRLAFISRLEQK